MPLELHAGALDATPFVCGELRIRALDPAADAAWMHHWFTLPHAGFWGMQHKGEHEVREAYLALARSPHALACVGLWRGRPAFVLECYDPAHDELARHYPVRAGDVGMHVFVGPPDVPVHGFTRRVFDALMRFIFERLHAKRVVVEPDVRNAKVHALNRAVGFVYDRAVQLSGKRAALAFCTRERFVLSRTEEIVE
ncbi:MAG TPA: GNAT family N-acetyltransferase [Methylibium sp.]|uniref:GNAT family N-acetyltransferase n=1 Tax=Methylibium sp. TaxID=2067992 RepID=UPI002DB7D4CF|nr:GNAT family N-acetyltransferase [Methylibium sp.]HEU4460558.1 GNAT family N-acetyltransferase [Methylibium sp.]